MTALGEMVAGTIHDIKNPITVITASASMLSKVERLNEEKILKISKRISSTSERILKIVNSVKVFVRNGEDDPHVNSDLLELIEETCDICNSKIHNSNVEIKYLNPDDSFFIEMNTTKMFLLGSQ